MKDKLSDVFHKNLSATKEGAQAPKNSLTL